MCVWGWELLCSFLFVLEGSQSQTTETCTTCWACQVACGCIWNMTTMHSLSEYSLCSSFCLEPARGNFFPRVFVWSIIMKLCGWLLKMVYQIPLQWGNETGLCQWDNAYTVQLRFSSGTRSPKAGSPGTLCSPEFSCAPYYNTEESVICTSRT